MTAFSQRKGMDSGSIRFMFDGQRVNKEDTPQGLGMEVNDTIDAMIEQQGGAAPFFSY